MGCHVWNFGVDQTSCSHPLSVDSTSIQYRQKSIDERIVAVSVFMIRYYSKNELVFSEGTFFNRRLFLFAGTLKWAFKVSNVGSVVRYEFHCGESTSY